MGEIMTRALKFNDEAEIAEVARAFFELKGWKLYPEVVIDFFNGRPDYMGVKNGTLCQSIECKKTLTYPVIEQLARWQIDADKRREWQKNGYESRIAIPHLLVAFVGRTSGRVSDLQKLLLEQYRIGVYSIEKQLAWGRKAENATSAYFETSSDDYWVLTLNGFSYHIREEVAPKIQPGSRKTAHRIIEAMNPDMDCVDAGQSGKAGGYMTPFKRTMNKVREILSDGKERHAQHIVDELNKNGGHHYCSDKVAMNSIATFIDKFGIAERSQDYGPWFQMKKSGAA